MEQQEDIELPIEAQGLMFAWLTARDDIEDRMWELIDFLLTSGGVS